MAGSDDVIDLALLIATKDKQLEIAKKALEHYRDARFATIVDPSGHSTKVIVADRTVAIEALKLL